MKTTLKELHLPNKDGGYESLYIEDFAIVEELNAISERVDIINERLGKLYYAVLKGESIDPRLPLYVESLEDNNTITFAGYRLGKYASQMEYSTDLIVWHSLVGVDSLTLNKYSKVHLHCIDGHIQGDLGALFNTSGEINVGGNLNVTMNDCISNPENNINPTLIENAYHSAFKETKVVDARKLLLPATSLSEHCYFSMFENCTTLTTAPALPATTLASRCYQYMFNGCTFLTTAPALPATKLANYCYYSMFQGCTSLTTAPALPATTLVYACYRSMFYNCTTLATAPALPATTLADYCCQYMFHGCTSLTTAPELPATTLASYCYYGMFQGCNNLSSITCHATDISANQCTTNWVNRVASSGTFTRAIGMDGWTKGVNGRPSGWTVQDYELNYVTFTAEEDSTIGLTQLSSNQKLLYSKDLSTWSLMSTTTSISLASGESAYIAGMLSANNTSSDYTRFKMTGKIAASGNCNALWNYIDVNATLKTYCGYYMFYGCTALTTAPELTATILSEHCYNSMFNGCSNLSSITCHATDISATDCTTDWVNGVASSGTFTRAIGMDGWTTGVNGVPSGWAVQDYVPNNYVTFTAEEDSTIGLANLSSNQKLLYSKDLSTWSLMDTTTSISLASGESAYIAGMLSADNTSSDYTQFKMTGKIAASGNCNALWNYIDVNATLKAYCGFHMFYECSKLTTAPELPATILAIRCYDSMFYRSALTTAPELPATTLAKYCYDSMFYNCIRLTSAPELPATILEDSCYYGMFRGCSKLTTAPELPATTLASWCYQYMFFGCGALATPPELPATTLAICCYSHMFFACISLATAPELPATELTNSCYYYMFFGCSKISSITCHATYINANQCTNDWVRGVASSGTFYKAASTKWKDGDSGIPIGWLQEVIV